jgi:hypothetical protein
MPEKIFLLGGVLALARPVEADKTGTRRRHSPERATRRRRVTQWLLTKLNWGPPQSQASWHSTSGGYPVYDAVQLAGCIYSPPRVRGPRYYQKYHHSLQSRRRWTSSPESTCQTIRVRLVTTASPSYTTPPHATRCSRETPQWVPTPLITGSDRATRREAKKRMIYTSQIGLVTGLSTEPHFLACENRNEVAGSSCAAFLAAHTTTPASL